MGGLKAAGEVVVDLYAGGAEGVDPMHIMCVCVCARVCVPG